MGTNDPDELGYGQTLPTVAKSKEHGKRAIGVKNFWGDPTKAEEYKKRQLQWGALYRRDCRKCGKPLGLGYGIGGKEVALCLSTPVYCVTGEKDPRRADGIIQTHLAYADHSATCPVYLSEIYPLK